MKEVILLIAYDNGAVHRGSLSEDALVDKVMTKLRLLFTEPQLVAAQIVLDELTKPELRNLCCGADHQRPQVLPVVNEILDEVFNAI